MEEEVLKIINKYPQVFTDKIGQAINLQVRLQVKDPTPVKIRPYYLSPPAVIKMKSIIDDWLSQGIIEPSTAEWSSPAFLTKRDRLVINYSELNKKLVKIDYPMGDINNIYQHLQGAKYFTIIDLNKAFLQCTLTEDSRDISSFVSQVGKFRFCRLPFGLQVGTSVLANYLDRLFQDAKFSYLINYCDDIIIYSNTKEEHLTHLKQVIQRLANNNLTVNVEKAKFFCTEITFLGHLITNNTVTIDPSRTSSIKDFPVPKTIKQCRRFVGMCSYWSRYIPNFADLCLPLHRLKRKGARFVWSDECQRAFEQLKQCISNPPVLQLINCDNKFVLHTDASNTGAGSVLLQPNSQNDLLPVAYYSRKFTDQEMKYSTYEKECLAIILSFEKWYEYLRLRKFTLVTDNEALSFVLNSKNKLGRLSRWIEKLLSLDYDVIHSRGENNVIADAMSRLFQDDKENESDPKDVNVTLNTLKTLRHTSDTDNIALSAQIVGHDEVDTRSISLLMNLTELPLALTDIKHHQDKDMKIQEIVQSIRNKTNSDCFYLKDGTLMYRNAKRKNLIYVPDNLMNLIYTFYHNTVFGGHQGIARTQCKINEYFYNPKMNEYVKQRVRECHVCLSSKQAQRKYEGKLTTTPATRTMQSLYIDVYGPVSKSKKGNRYIFLASDGFSGFNWIFPMRDCTSRIIIEKLESIYGNFSVPQTIVTDNASYFVSASFKAHLFRNYIQHRRIIPYRPSGNKSERMLKNLGTLLRCFYHDRQEHWDENISEVQLSLNTARNSSTGFSPFTLMFVHPPNNVLSNLWSIHDLLGDDKTMDERKENLRRAITNIRRSIKKNENSNKYGYPQHRHPFKEEDLVYIKTHYLSDKAKHFSKKLGMKFIGPFKILMFTSQVTAVVQRVEDLRDVRRVHLGDMKLMKHVNSDKC